MLAFLDVTGAWNPSLLVVMAGAASTFGLLYRWRSGATRRSSQRACVCRTTATWDRRLFIGTTLFGIGWGLVGLCPGPAVTALFGGRNGSGRVFVVAMLGGIVAASWRPVGGCSRAGGRGVDSSDAR